MDQVDKTLISQLKDIGCSCCDDELSSLQDLSPEQVMSCALHCIHLILPAEKQDSIPKDPGSNMNMVTKYNLASFLTNSCKDLGFRGDLGYQSFLYGSEADVRRVFLFLIEKLPREAIHDSPNKPMSVMDRIKRSPALNAVWTNETHPKSKPIATVSLTNMINTRSVVLNKINPTKRRYYDKFLDIPFHDIASILAWNRKQLAAASSSSSPNSLTNIAVRVTRREKPPVTPRRSSKPAAVQLSPVKEAAVYTIPDDGSNLESSGETAELQPLPKEKTSLELLQEEIGRKNHELDEAESATSNIEKALSELSSSLKEENLRLLELKSRNLTIEELRILTGNLQSEYDQLDSQWNDIKSGLLQEIAAFSTRRTQIEDELRQLKNMIRSRRREITIKQQLVEELTAKVPNPFPPTRNAYTKRIMEILNNIKKLDLDTKKVVTDTRALQKEISLLTGKVQRSFSVADETVFSSAKLKTTDEFSKKSYKLLAQVHEETTRLSEGIASCGVIRRDVIGLEEAVQKQQNMDIESKLQKIQSDIIQVKQSNQVLLSQVDE